jgi:hypothetical protein
MKDRPPEVRSEIRPEFHRVGDSPLLWITVCTVGVAHPCAEAVETALAWRTLESACASASKWDSESLAATRGRR